MVSPLDNPSEEMSRVEEKRLISTLPAYVSGMPLKSSSSASGALVTHFRYARPAGVSLAP